MQQGAPATRLRTHDQQSAGLAADVGGAAAAVFGDAEADEGAGEGGLHLGGGLEGLLVLEGVLGAFAGLRRAFEVDLVGALGGVGEDDDLVVEDLEEAAGDGEGDLVGALLEDELAGGKHGHEGGVLGEDGELALDAGSDDFIDAGLLEELAFYGDDFDGQWHVGLTVICLLRPIGRFSQAPMRS